jgi:hypothetical protein
MFDFHNGTGYCSKGSGLAFLNGIDRNQVNGTAELGERCKFWIKFGYGVGGFDGFSE